MEFSPPTSGKRPLKGKSKAPQTGRLQSVLSTRKVLS
jgi:hypothetical protein